MSEINDNASSEKTKIIIKCTAGEKEAMQKNADLYCKGNMSRWIRFSGQNMKPTKRQMK